MQIDVTDQIDKAIAATAAWADDVGFQAPEAAGAEVFSKKARDVARILSASEFGCQERQVRALVEILIDEKLPAFTRGKAFDYANPGAGFRQNTVLVPLDYRYEGGVGRPGLMLRVSKSGNVGLRLSNGEMSAQYHGLSAVRPATEQEIRDYFAEFYGLQISPFDTIEEPEEQESAVIYRPPPIISWDRPF